MKKISILFLLFISISSYSQKIVKKTTYFDNSREVVHEIYSFININGINKLHGLYREYDKYGNLNAELNYSNGLLNGESKKYLSADDAYMLSNNPHYFIKNFAGKLIKVAKYNHGVLDGWDIDYNIDFDTGKRNIQSKTFYRKGLMLSEEKYFLDGSPEKICKNGKCIEYFDGNHIKLEYEYKNGKKNGLSTLYNYDGTIKSKAIFRDDYIVTNNIEEIENFIPVEQQYTLIKDLIGLPNEIQVVTDFVTIEDEESGDIKIINNNPKLRNLIIDKNTKFINCEERNINFENILDNQNNLINRELPFLIKVKDNKIISINISCYG